MLQLELNDHPHKLSVPAALEQYIKGAHLWEHHHGPAHAWDDTTPDNISCQICSLCLGYLNPQLRCQAWRCRHGTVLVLMSWQAVGLLESFNAPGGQILRRRLLVSQYTLLRQFKHQKMAYTMTRPQSVLAASVSAGGDVPPEYVSWLGGES